MQATRLDSSPGATTHRARLSRLRQSWRDEAPEHRRYPSGERVPLPYVCGTRGTLLTIPPQVSPIVDS